MRKICLSTAAAVLMCANSGFANPKVGDRLPDVSAFDEQGEAFPLRETLDGSPAVIVFGCLP